MIAVTIVAVIVAICLHNVAMNRERTKFNREREAGRRREAQAWQRGYKACMVNWNITPDDGDPS